MNSEVNSSKQGKFEKSRWILLIKINSPNGEKQSQRGSQRHFKRSLLNGGKGLNLIDLLLLSFNRSLQYFQGNYLNITIKWATFNTNHMPGAVSIDASIGASFNRRSGNQIQFSIKIHSTQTWYPLSYKAHQTHTYKQQQQICMSNRENTCAWPKYTQHGQSLVYCIPFLDSTEFSITQQNR